MPAWARLRLASSIEPTSGGFSRNSLIHLLWPFGNSLLCSYGGRLLPQSLTSGLPTGLARLFLGRGELDRLLGRFLAHLTVADLQLLLLWCNSLFGCSLLEVHLVPQDLAGLLVVINDAGDRDQALRCLVVIDDTGRIGLGVHDLHPTIR